MAMSLLQQLKCQLKYHKKYVSLQNNNCRTDQIIHLLTFLFSQSQNIKQSLVESNDLIL